MPNRVQWHPHYSTGNEILDHQHKAILAQCNDLADFISDSGEEDDLKFEQRFNELMALARRHFSEEAAFLAGSAYPLCEEHKDERDEFEYLAADIVTTGNFEKSELQRFLALWWVGHITESGKKYRPFLAGK